MTNPYKPSNQAENESAAVGPAARYAFAGRWLLASGVLHFVAINLLARVRSLHALDLSPLLLSLLGVLVLHGLRVAVVFTRLIGSCTIVGLFLVAALFIAGYGGGGVVYGRVEISDPAPWQIGLMLLAVSATVLPPWWALQRAFSE